MPTVREPFTYDGTVYRPGDLVDEVPDGLDRLFDPDPAVDVEEDD